MSQRSAIALEDISRVLADTVIPWHKLDTATVLITGSTGLIGKTLTDVLLAYAAKSQTPPKLVLPVRNIAKAIGFFGAQNPQLELIEWDADQPLCYEGRVDYILHCAAQTSSKGFVEQPVETAVASFCGTRNLLEFAKQKKVKGIVYLSTMEVYGTPQTDDKIGEDYVGVIDPLNVRNCYPESKRLCENLCVSYYSEYGLPTYIARLTQTFGPGVQADDQRVFAEFARCAIEQTDIILHTKGETKRNYLYTADAVRALLTVMLCGHPGQAYNLANEQTYCSIYEMACMVAKEVADGRIEVRCEIQDTQKFGYAPVLHMNLDTAKLCALGWQAQYDLQQMFVRMIADFGHC